VDKLNKERRIIATGNSVNSLPVATNMRKISWNDELARIAQMWAVQCNMELDYYRTALIDGVPVQFGQNIARFEFNSDIGISETQINELVNYWINSYEPQVLDLINNKYTYQPPQDEYNLSYFTQMAWALTDRIGCGYARYKEGDNQKSTSVFVCNFANEGNILDAKVYETGSNPCSACGSNYVCEPALPGETPGLCVKS